MKKFFNCRITKSQIKKIRSTSIFSENNIKFSFLNASSTSTITEIQFLSKSDLCSALNRGFIKLYHTRFIELYHSQPKNPILFLNFFKKKSKTNELKKIKTRRPLQRKIKEDFYRKRE